VLVHQQLVGLLYQGVEHHADLTLAGGTDLVVMHFDVQAHFFHGQAHGRAQVVLAVDRRYREIAALDTGPVAHVAFRQHFFAVPGGFFGVDAVPDATHLGMPVHGVEHEELGFRAEERGVGDAGRLQIGFGALGDGARVALVTHHGVGFEHVAADDDRRL